ncbi:MAG: c-type cytochrome domain-containing protein [Pirellulales bacterium]
MRNRTIDTIGALGIAAALAVAWQIPAAADEAPPAKITYDEHVKPIFREHCFSCHNDEAKKSDLSLATFSSLTTGGASGAVIEPGDPDSSRLWGLVSHSDEPNMPPEQDKLPDAKLEVIKKWITGGALENNGSVAKVKKGPALDMNVAAGSAKPEGPPPMPEKLLRQPVVYTTRAAAVTAIAASPWAPLAAVAGQKQIALYNTDTAELAGVLPFPEGMAHVLKFSRAGTLLLAGGGIGAKSGSVVVYDVKTGKRLLQVGEELDLVLAADINEDHTRIALGGPGRVVRVFNTADGSLVHEIKKHTEWIYAVEFSPDGVLLATADRGGGLFVWEAETAREYQNLAGHKGGVTDVSWRADSNLLASASEDGTIKLWEIENGREIKNWGAHGGGVTAVEFAQDGKIVSAGRDRLTKLWDAGGGAIREFPAFGDLAMEVAITHNSGRVIAGDWLGEVRLWEAADGNQVAHLPPNPPTLEMLVDAQSAAAATAAEAAQKAAAEVEAQKTATAAAAEAAKKTAAELAAAEAALAEKTKASQAAAAAASAAKAQLDGLAAEKAAFDQTQTAQANAAK